MLTSFGQLQAKILNDPKKRKEWERAIFGPPRRVIEGTEADHMILLFTFLEPVSESNNQRSLTQVYNHAGKEYHVTYFPGEDTPLIEEMLNDD